MFFQARLYPFTLAKILVPPPDRAHHARGARLGGAIRAGLGAVLAALALSGCLGGWVAEPGASGTSDAISVTALPDPGTEPQQDAVAQDAAEDEAAKAATTDDVATFAPQRDPNLPDTGRRAPPRRPATAGANASPPVRPAATVAPTGPPPLPVPSTVFGQQMQEQARNQCAQAGGRLGRRGASGALTCFIQPRDAGKICSRASDCQGACLARSGTCSPVIPLLGCHEVLLDSGRRVTECLE
jgi:hypothetical protein